MRGRPRPDGRWFTQRHAVSEERLSGLHPTSTLGEKARQLLIILVPILLTQIAISMMNFADTVMAGRFSSVDLAGVAIGGNIWAPVQNGLASVLLALTPIVAQHLGARREREIAPAVAQALYLAVALAGAVIAVGVRAVPVILERMSLEPEVRRIAAQYLAAIALGLVPSFAYAVLRSFMDALGQTRATMGITMLSLPINVLLNYVLIFGAWGFPRLGGVGAGYATALTHWIIAVIALVVVTRVEPFRAYRLFGGLPRPSWRAWAEQLRIGVPMGAAVFMEVGIFAMVALLMSRFGTVTVAAHQAAINFGSLLYMIPMSIAMALTITVGYEAGARRLDHARQYAALGLGASLSMAVLTATFLALFRGWVAGWYSDDAAVRHMTESFLYYVIFFQLSDAVAAPIQGTLRGHKDVNVTMVVALLSYWVVGLPLGYMLATFTALGPYGYWIGLIAGLAAGAAGLAWRLRAVYRRLASVSPAAEAPRWSSPQA